MVWCECSLAGNEEKEMKKQFGKLSKKKQEKVEARYHDKSPQEFDAIMSEAVLHRPREKKKAGTAPQLSQKPGRKKGLSLARHSEK
jgi:hypothetical protein